MEYDSTGRVLDEVDSLGGITRHHYNAYGYADRLSDGNDCVTYWQAQAMDARGNITQEQLGDSVNTIRLYDTGHARYKRKDSGKTSTTYYLGAVELSVHSDGHVEARRTVGPAVITTDSREAQPAVHYLLKDHLGSTDVVVDDKGAITQSFSFDAFGKQRNPATWASVTDPLIPLSPFAGGAVTSRGYTGHEMLDELGLMHMNGRVYDPTLGRFVSADPDIQAPYNPQNLNRYSYVLNNPLSYTDPTGFNFWRKYGRTVLAIAISAFMPYVLVAMGIQNAIVVGAITGALAGYASTGTLSGAFTGAVTGAAFGALHYWTPKAGEYGMMTGKVLAHGAVGGLSSVLQGGKFGSGFASAGVMQSLSQTGVADALLGSDPTDYIDRVSNAIGSAIIGGTISEMTGGKFANGAIVVAFSRLLNDTALTFKQKNTSVGISVDDEGKAKISAKIRNFLTTSLDKANVKLDLKGAELNIGVEKNGRVTINGSVNLPAGQLQAAYELVDGLQSLGYELHGGSITLSNFSRESIDWKLGYTAKVGFLNRTYSLNWSVGGKLDVDPTAYVNNWVPEARGYWSRMNNCIDAQSKGDSC